MAKKTIREGEEALILAVLEDAIACFQKYLLAQNKRASKLAFRLDMDRRTETQTPERRGWNSGGGEHKDGTLAYLFPRDSTRRS
jgi:hypothetical protein